jgi:hypothetical protein
VEKRTVITVAGAITLTVLASTSALAVNFRGAADQPPGDVGTFAPTADATLMPPQVVTVYVDVPTGAVPVAVTMAPPPAATLGAGASATEPITTTRASSVAAGDDEHENEASERSSDDEGGDDEGGEDDD